MKKKDFIKILFFLLLTLTIPLFFLSSNAAELQIQQFENGAIHWQEGKIIANATVHIPEGDREPFITIPRLEEQCQEKVLLNLINIILKLRINYQVDFAKLLQYLPEYQYRIYQFLQDNIHYNDPQITHSQINLSAYIPLYGKNGIAYLIFSFDDRVVSERAVYRGNSQYQLQYDSIVIDLRGMDFSPSLFPYIYTDNGQLIYFPNLIPAEIRGEITYIHYEDDPFAFHNRIYSTDRPTPTEQYTLFIAANRTVGEYNTDIVVSNEDATRILSHLNNIEFLRSGNIYLITD